MTATINFAEYDFLEDKTHSIIIADSLSEVTGKRLTTFLLTIPRIILPELTRHRVYSFSIASSRAKRVQKVLQQTNYTPQLWLRNHKGMQGNVLAGGWREAFANTLWKVHQKFSIGVARLLDYIDISKQYSNRLIEPHSYVDVLMTGTEWDNFIEQRDSPHAQFEIQVVARQIKLYMKYHQPDVLKEFEWHLPFVTDEEKAEFDIYTLIRLSAARCARTSYSNQNKKSQEDDIALYDKLTQSGHWSPLEHQAQCIDVVKSGNFDGWAQWRQMAQNKVTPQ